MVKRGPVREQVDAVAIATKGRVTSEFAYNNPSKAVKLKRRN